MAEIENEKRAENEIENKFSIDNKGKSTQTGIMTYDFFQCS